MKKKVIVVVAVVVLFVLLIFGGGMGDSTVSGSSDDNFETSFYIEDNGNVFIKVAKVADKCCFFLVDIVISGVSSIFDMLLGG